MKTNLLLSTMAMMLLSSCSINNKNILEPINDKQLKREIKKDPDFEEVYRIKELSKDKEEFSEYESLQNITYGELKSLLHKIKTNDFLKQNIIRIENEYRILRNKLEKEIRDKCIYHLDMAKERNWNKKVKFTFVNFETNNEKLYAKLISNVDSDYQEESNNARILLKLHLNIKDCFEKVIDKDKYLDIAIEAYQYSYFYEIKLSPENCNQYLIEITNDMKELIEKNDINIFEINTHIQKVNGVPNEHEYNVYTSDLYKEYLIAEFEGDPNAKKILSDIVKNEFGEELLSLDNYLSKELTKIFTKKELEILFLLTL